MNTPRPVTTLRVSPPNQRPFLVHCYTSKLAEKLAKYPDAVVLGQTTTPADGIIPTHVGKSIQQERAEKAAAKLASQNQQRGGKRIERQEKRAVVAKPAPERLSYPVPAHSRVARPIVNLSTGTYYPSRSAAERGEGVGENGINYKLQLRHPARIREHIYDYATLSEVAAGACQRAVTPELSAAVDSPRPRKPMGPRKQVQYRAIVNLSTGAFYASQSQADKMLGCSRDNVRRAFRRAGEPDTVRVIGNLLSYATDEETRRGRCLRQLVLTPIKRPQVVVSGKAVICLTDKTIYATCLESAKKNRFGKWRLANLQAGEVRQTPAGAFRRATEHEVEQWKRKNGK